MIDLKAKFVPVLVFGLDPEDLPSVAREVAMVAKRKGPLMDGFIECVTMTNEDKTQLLVVSLWESKHAWGAAQWDEDVGRVVADAMERSASFELRTYEPISVVRGQI
jgi:heme-degrading monooxygenase HmoA